MSKITKSARDEECQVRIPGICNFDPKTTVFAHLNGGGMGMKASDFAGSYSCSDCHDIIDGRVKQTIFNDQEIQLFHYDGVIRTQELLVAKGLIEIK